jgi:hypothetical protein
MTRKVEKNVKTVALELDEVKQALYHFLLVVALY